MAGLFAPGLYGQSVLTFPRVISNANTFTELAVDNPGATEASVTFAAFLPDGTTFAASGIQNPVTVRIPAGGQIADLFGDIFGSRDFNGWVQATSSSIGLTGFFLNGNWALTDLDGAGTIDATGEFVLPLAAEDAVVKTELTLVNVSSEATVAAVTVYTSEGAPAATQDLSIPAHGLIRRTLRDVFGNADLGAVSHMRVRSNRPLVGHEVVADFMVPGTSLRRESIALSGRSATAGTSYVLPQFAAGGGWLSLLGIVNDAGVGQDITLTAYREDGTVWDVPSNPIRVSLNGHGALQITAGDLFGFPAETVSTGWIEVEGSVGFLSSYIAFGNEAAPSFAAIAGTEVSEASRYQAFSHIAEGGDFFTGLTLINPGTTDANVEFYLLRPDGTTVGRATFTVKPKERLGRVFSELLPSSLFQQGGWAFVRSSQPLVGAVLVGSTNGSSLANVPPQVSAGDFVPPAQTTAAISGSVHSAGEPIPNVQITLSGPVVATTTTDGLGRYTFPQLPSGDYNVAAIRLGAQFVPSGRSVAVDRQNVDDVDFEGGGITAANAPVIQFISPTSTFAGNSSFSIRVFGSNFTPGSVIKLNDEPLMTSFVNSGELQGIVTAAQLAQPVTVKVVVETPPPGGGASQSADFTVNLAPKDPLIEGRATVGSFPTGVAIDSRGNSALVTNQSSDSVVVVDLKTMKVKTTISVGRSPAEGIAVHKAKNIALVVNPGSNNVSVIDLVSNRVTKEIGVGRFPVGIAINAATNRAVVTNAEDGTITIIDLDSLTAIAQIAVGVRPLNVAIQPQTNQAVVTDTLSNAVWIIDLNTNAVLGSVKVGQFPRGIAINTLTNIAVVANANSNDVSVIDLTTRAVVLTVKVDVGPTGVAIHELTNTALITNSGVPRGSTNYSVPTTVSVLDLGILQVTRTIPVGSAAFGVDIDQDNQQAAIANFGSNDVTLIRIPNPKPRPDDISPRTFSPGGGAFTITVRGVGFLQSSIVTLNGQPLPTTYVSYSELHAEVSPILLDQLLQVQTAVIADDQGASFKQVTELQFNVSVSNPGPGGGDALPAADPQTRRIFPQNAVPVLISMSPTDGPTGRSLTLTLSGNNFNGTSIINFGTSRYSPTSSSPTSMMVTVPAGDLTAGIVPVFVTNPPPVGGTSALLTFRVNSTSNATPTITRVSPSSVQAGSGPVTVTVEGTRFATGATATLDTVHGTVSGNTAVLNLVADQTLRPRTLNGMISNPAPDGGSASFSVNVLNPIPTISGFTPLSANAGSPAVTISVSGSNFGGMSQITVADTPIATRFVSETSLSGTIPESILIRGGEVRIGVTNPAPGGGSATGGAFKINSPLPVLTAATPSRATLQTTSLIVRLTGSGFIGNSAVSANGSPLAAVSDSTTSLTVTVPAVLLTQTGVFSIRVTNPAPEGGTSDALLFPVENPAPELNSVSPLKLRADQANVVITVTGKDFVNGATISVGSQVLATTFISATRMTGVLAPPLPLGIQTVKITNPPPGGGVSGGIDIGIDALPPTITAVTPSVVGAGQPFQVTGTNFGLGSKILLRGLPIPTDVPSSTQIIGTIPTSETTGPADVVVRNPATAEVGTQDSNPVTIQIVNPVPVVTSVDPSAAQGGASITVHGSGFVLGCQVLLNGVSVGGAFLDSSTVVFTLPANAPIGSAGVQVTNPPPGGGASNTVSISVVSPTPVVTGLSPSSGLVGTTVVPTISGSNFVSGATVSFEGATVLSTNFISSTSLIVVVQLPSTAGPASVSVTNPGGVTSNVVSFDILPSVPPTLSQISPDTAVTGTTVMPLTLTGTDFVVGATSVAVSGTGVTVGPVTVTSATQLTTSFTIASSATTDVRSVTVTTSRGTSNSVSFAIMAPSSSAPTVSQISPNTGIAGTTVAPVTLTGTNFVVGATSVTVGGTGVTVGAVNVTSATQLTTSFTIASTAGTNVRNVTVATPDGTSNNVPFTVTALTPGAPTLSQISPNTGVTATTVAPVTLTGTNFVIGATTVTVNGTGVTVGAVNVTSATQLTTSFTVASTAPPDVRNVTVNTSAGTSNSVAFTITSPTLFAVSPAAGTVAGGTRVVITGPNFTSSDVTVTFGDTFGSGALRLSSTQVAVFTPPHPAGAVSVTVTSGSAKTQANAFTFRSNALGNTFSTSQNLTVARSNATATLLNDGRVLVAGGVSRGDSIAATDVSNASSGLFSAGPTMLAARSGHTATLMADGRVLILGGHSSFALRTAEFLNVAGTAFSAALPMAVGRYGHTATLLADGRVLVIGGYDSEGRPLATAEIYNPLSDGWSKPISLTTARVNHQATLLADARVLVTGNSETAEIFNPGTNTFSAVPASMQANRSHHVAVLLTDGRVLIAGGYGSTVALASAEIFNGSTFTPTANSLPIGAALSASALLGNGKVLVAGGDQCLNGCPSSASAMFDPATGSFTANPPMNQARIRPATVRLPNATVWIIGGYSSGSLRSTEIFGADSLPVATTSSLDGNVQ